MHSLRKTLQLELFSLQALCTTIGIALVYIFFVAYLLNYRFISQIFWGHFSLSSKMTILMALATGIWTSISLFDVFLLVLNALLVGINISLAIRTLYYLKHEGKVKVSIGGATLIGLVTTGCTSCGFSLLSVIGLSATVSFLPFHGLELHVLAIALLIISFIYMIKQLHYAKYCRIPIIQTSSRKR